MCKIFYNLPVRLRSFRYRSRPCTSCDVRPAFWLSFASLVLGQRILFTQSVSTQQRRYGRTLRFCYMETGPGSYPAYTSREKSYTLLSFVLQESSASYLTGQVIAHSAPFYPPRSTVFALPIVCLTLLAVQVLAHYRLLSSIQSSTGCASHLSRHPMSRRTRRVISIPSTS